MMPSTFGIANIPPISNFPKFFQNISCQCVDLNVATLRNMFKSNAANVPQKNHHIFAPKKMGKKSDLQTKQVKQNKQFRSPKSAHLHSHVRVLQRVGKAIHAQQHHLLGKTTNSINIQNQKISSALKFENRSQ